MTTSILNIVFRRKKSSNALLILSFCLVQFAAPQSAFGQAGIGSADSSSLEKTLPPGFMDSVSIDFTSLAKAATKSPGGAVLRALVLPGWGQFYTGHAVRGGLAAALETVFFTSAFIQYRDRNKLRDQLKRLERELGDQTPAEDPRVDLNDRIRNRSLKGGDYLAYGLTTLVLSLIDSYVSAHLYQFDRNFQVSVSGGSSLAFRFQLDLLGVVRPVSRSHPATATPAR